MKNSPMYLLLDGWGKDIAEQNGGLSEIGPNPNYSAINLT